jgi:hypothetical protein
MVLTILIWYGLERFLMWFNHDSHVCLADRTFDSDLRRLILIMMQIDENCYKLLLMRKEKPPQPNSV